MKGYLVALSALVGLALVCGNNSQNNDYSYLILAPAKARAGSVYKLGVNFYPKSGTASGVQLTANLNSHGTYSASFAPGQTRGELQIPVPNDASGSLTIKLSSTGDVVMSDSVSVPLMSKSLSVFVQSDKAIYKPSQVVNFRCMVVNDQLLPYPGSVTVLISDPNKNKIKIWNNVPLKQGVFTAMMELSDQPVLGDWRIQVTTDKGDSSTKAFKVDEYVLPKFEVTVEPPSFINLMEEKDVQLKIDAKYTYGKGVDGKAVLRFFTNDHSYYFSRGNFVASQSFTNIQLVDGKADVTVPLSTYTKLLSQYSYLSTVKFQVEANVTEELTGITRNGSASVTGYKQGEKMEFLDASPSNFKPGLNYRGFVKLSKQDGTPLGAAVKVTLDTTFTIVTSEPSAPWFSEPTKSERTTTTFDIPMSGLADFSISVPAKTKSVSMKVSYRSISVTKSISAMRSPSNNYLQLLLTSKDIQAGGKASFDISSTEASQAHYWVMARGRMVASGAISLGAWLTQFSLPVTSAMAPTARFIVYYVRSTGEMVTDGVNFNVAGAFKNNVALKFSKAKAEPGDDVNLEVTADVNSYVGVLAVDQSVLLLAQGNDVTQGDVLGELNAYDTTSSSSSSSPRWSWWYPYALGGSDAQSVLDSAGVITITDAWIYKYVAPPINRFPGGGGFFGGFGGFADAAFAGVRPQAIAALAGPELASIDSISDISSAKPGQEEPTRTRTFFPESWLWLNTNISANGKAQIATQVPDTITSWVASAFAMSPLSGLGITEDPSKLQVFRPFFVSLNLPYSVVRGEQVVLQAIVFNYMGSDANVQVTLDGSDDFSNILVDANGRTTYAKSTSQVQSVLVPAGQGKTVSFPVVPTGLGYKDISVKASAGIAADAVIRQLLVEPEGVEQAYNVPVMIDLTKSSTFKWRTDVELPPDAIRDSVRVEFSVVGDILGPSINGLDKLIKMPYGCGEQNMLNFAPTVFVTNYLQNVGELSGALKDKSIGFMEKGYQRELTYQREDGSFSAFGQRDDAGSMWLTAFVVKSFSQARNFIFIDNELVERATTWIADKQRPDGSFPEPGRIIHKEMTSKSGSGDSLTAFVLVAILEVKKYSSLTPAASAKIAAAATGAQKYLETHMDNVNDPYSLALLSYSLQLAGSSQAQLARNRLHAMAKNSGSETYWEQPQPAPPKNANRWHSPHNQAKAVNVEVAAYALLDVSLVNDINKGLPVLKWLTGQRNGNGGFSSTQDTVMALQALSQFASLYSASTDMSLALNDGFSTQNFKVNKANAIILQSTVLPSDTKAVQLTGSGSGIAVAQVTVTFNVAKFEQEPAFQTTAKVLQQSLGALKLEVCARWLLPDKSGMAVTEIGLPTGFTADVEGLRLARYSGIKRIETSGKKVILYHDEITPVNRCVILEAERTGLVAKTQPAAVKVYDYYEPENQVTIFYAPSVLESANICDVCGTSCDTCQAYLRRK